MNRVRFCRRLAISPEQGQGWSEYSGRQWLCPKENGGATVVYDTNGNRRLVFEQKGFMGPAEGEDHSAYDGMILESATSDKTVSSGYGDTGSDGIRVAVPFSKYFKGMMNPDRSLLRIEEIRLTTLKTSNADVDASYSMSVTPTPEDFFETRTGTEYFPYAECMGVVGDDDITFNSFSLVSDYLAIRLTGLFGATGDFSRSPKITSLLLFLTSMPRTCPGRSTSLMDLQLAMTQNLVTWITFSGSDGAVPINIVTGEEIIQHATDAEYTELAPMSTPPSLLKMYYATAREKAGIYLNHPEIPAGESFHVAVILSAFNVGNTASVTQTISGVVGATELYVVPGTDNLNMASLIVYAVPAQAAPVPGNSIMLDMYLDHPRIPIIEFRGYYYPNGTPPALNGVSMAPYIIDTNKARSLPLFSENGFGAMFIPAA